MSRRPRRPRGQRSVTDIDVHVGQRMRQRRLLLGISQQQLAAALGLTFQQVQKYERGTNRVSASRLFQLARVLDVPIMWFYDGINAARGDGQQANEVSELMDDPETLRFIKAYYRIKDDKVRRRFRGLASIMAGES